MAVSSRLENQTAPAMNKQRTNKKRDGCARVQPVLVFHDDFRFINFRFVPRVQELRRVGRGGSPGQRSFMNYSGPYLARRGSVLYVSRRRIRKCIFSSPCPVPRAAASTTASAAYHLHSGTRSAAPARVSVAFLLRKPSTRFGMLSASVRVSTTRTADRFA